MTPHGYGRCVQMGCSEAPARTCNVKTSVCGNAFLMNPCTEKQSGDSCSLGTPDADGSTKAGTCTPFTCTDGGTTLGCYVPMAPDLSAPGRSPAGASSSGSGTSSSNDGASSTSSGDDEGGCAMSPRGGGSSSLFVVALTALGVLGRKRRSSAATGRRA
ncbi:MAG: hypothetical protein KF795_29875 [Labilithrix sp.]|nr:hypothetical protein [Labilithrix sp.]